MCCSFRQIQYQHHSVRMLGCVCMFCDNLSLDIHLHVDNDFSSLKPISHSLGSEESLFTVWLSYNCWLWRFCHHFSLSWQLMECIFGALQLYFKVTIRVKLSLHSVVIFMKLIGRDSWSCFGFSCSENGAQQSA